MEHVLRPMRRCSNDVSVAHTTYFISSGEYLISVGLLPSPTNILSGCELVLLAGISLVCRTWSTGRSRFIRCWPSCVGHRGWLMSNRIWPMATQHENTFSNHLLRDIRRFAAGPRVWTMLCAFELAVCDTTRDNDVMMQPLRHINDYVVRLLFRIIVTCSFTEFTNLFQIAATSCAATRKAFTH